MTTVETTAATSVHHATYLLLLSVELISSFNVIPYTFSYSIMIVILYNYGIHLSSDRFSMSVRQVSKHGQGSRPCQGRQISQFYLHVCACNSHFAPLLTTSIQRMNCYWHYMFPVAISPRNTAFPEAPVSQHTGLGISQPNKKNACSGCLGQLCGRSTHRSCGNWCCRTCCIINGGCRLVSYTNLSITNDSRFVMI